MKGGVYMKHSKFVVSFIAVLIFLSAFSGCNAEKDYNGKDIVSFEYITVDSMGGATNYKKMLLNSGEIYEKNYYPYGEYEANNTEYQLINTFDASKKQEIIKKFYNIGLLELEEEYRAYDVIDGGSWNFIIEYSDGTKKSSLGVNDGPYHLFTEAVYCFYNITGVDFWGRVRKN